MILFDFLFFFFFNCSFHLNVVVWVVESISSLSLFFLLFLVFLWLLLNEAKLKDSGVLWLKTAVDMCLLCCWQETETWQLVCVSLWEHTWICFMVAWTRRHKKTILFSVFFYSEEVCSYTFSLLYFVAVVQMRQIYESTGGSSCWKVPLFFVWEWKL